MKRLIIVGGGISGLIANWVFKRCRGLEVKVMEQGKVGGDFLAGGLKYIHRTDDMAEMLSDLGVVFTNYNVQGGILIHEKIEPYPAVLKSMDKDRALRIQQDHYRKTRKTEPDQFAAKSMNDPEASGSRKALRADARALIQAFEQTTPVIADSATHIQPGRIHGKSGASYPYGYLVLTIPLWIIRRMVWFELPEALAIKLNVVQVDPHQDVYAKWDYVYTPYTPENLIHRLSPREGGYSCEFNGDWVEGATNDKLTSELNWLFKDGWALSDVKKGLNGHLLPLSGKSDWPKNIRPLGRFAQWDPRATSDVVLDSCIKMAEEWNFERRNVYD